MTGRGSQARGGGKLVLLLLAVLAGGCASARPLAVSAPPPIAVCAAPDEKTTAGEFCGTVETVDAANSASGKVYRYLGIHYGESTAGEHRWMSPVPYAPRPGTFAATEFGPLCPQPNRGETNPQSEDCLTINVWRPAPAETAEAPLPVMFFIYGGSFLVGGSSAGVYDGARLAAEGHIVIVSFNYRVGALGFLSGLDGLTGNYGFLDQQLALLWVRRNIGAFGGDPDRVTIWGESAGAMSVGLHLVAPQSQGLFRAAIMESNPYGIPYKNQREAADFAKDLRDLMGCEIGGIECMRRAPVETILAHQTSDLIIVGGLLEGLRGELVWAPVIDGVVIPDQPSKVATRIPMLIGTNRDEGALFVGGFRIKIPFEVREIPRVEYEAALDLVFADGVAHRIEAQPRYAPVDGDNTNQFAHVLGDYLFTCANRHVMNDARGPVYAYRYDHLASYDEWPGVPLCAPDQHRVCHSFELPFVFGNPVDVRLETAPPAAAAHFSARDQIVADQMMRYWTNFAATLDPDDAEAPKWPEFNRAHPAMMVFEDEAHAGNRNPDCGFWDSIGYDSRGMFARSAK